MSKNTVGQIVSVSPAAIYVSPELRTRLAGAQAGDVAKMQTAIARDGQLSPIGIVAYKGDEDYKFTLVFGEHRLKACEELEINVLATVLEDMDALDHLSKSYNENNDRKEVSPVDRMHVARTFRTVHKLKNKEIAERMKLDAGEITRLRSIEKLSETIHAALASGVINMFAAVKLTEVSDLSEREKMAADGWTAKMISAWLDARDPEKIKEKELAAAAKAAEKELAKTASADGTGTTSTAGKKIGDVRTAVADAINATDGSAEVVMPLGEVCTRLLEFIDGEFNGGTSEVFADLVEKFKGKFKKAGR
jgi:ParB/RepB/Spo0J family partition protein